jgi:NAD(P)-dependent dehydrogenase (short-subunit alcohol dehydrogenase family)
MSARAAQNKSRSCTLITGANRGLGLHLARALILAGEDLLLVCRTPADLSALTHGTPDANLDQVVCDLRDPQALADQIGQALRDRSARCVINNAGLFSQDEEHGLRGLRPAAIMDMVAVNATAPAVITGAVQRYLTTDAVLVNILSDMAFPESWDGTYPLYRATKAFLWSLTVNTAAELGVRGVKTIGIDPGWMRTDMGGAEAPDDPREVAAGIVALLKRPQLLNNGTVYGLRDFAVALDACRAEAER